MCYKVLCILLYAIICEHAKGVIVFWFFYCMESYVSICRVSKSYVIICRVSKSLVVLLYGMGWLQLVGSFKL